MGVGTLTVPSGTFHLSGNPLFVQISGATIPSGATNYKVLCKVTSTDAVLIGGPFIDSKTPDGDGDALFDVSGYCDQPVVKTFDWPLSGGLVPYGNDTLDITFTPGESYIDENGDLKENWGSASAGNFVVKGGVSYRELGEFNDDSSSFYAEYVTPGKFLTRMPNNQVTHPYQPSKLWLLHDANETVELNISAVYDDGSSYLYQNNHVLYQNIMHEINVLPFHSDADMKPIKNDGAKMLYYEVFIADKTETRRFYVDHTYHEQCNYLFFLNSLGGVDCMWLNGSVQKGFKTESVQAIRPFAIDGSAKDRTMIVASRTGQRTWKINTGWKSRTDIDALKDLLLSKQVWLLEDAEGYNQGTLHPVTIETSSADLYDSMEDMFALDLEMVEAHNNQYL